MVNAADLKSAAAKAACGFEPHARHLWSRRRGLGDQNTEVAAGEAIDALLDV